MRQQADNLAKKYLPHFPAGLPDEHIASRVMRFHIRSGNLSSNVTFRQLFDRVPFGLNYLVQPYLDSLAEKIPGDSTENLNRIEQQGTLLPLFQQFYVGTDQKLLAAAKHKYLRRVVGDPGLTRICPQCLLDDEAEHGSPYLHRSHQVPGITACWRHAKPLIDRCPECARPFSLQKELVETAWHGCSCGLSTKDLAARLTSNLTKFEHQLAQFAHDLLSASPLPLNQTKLSEIYRRKAHAMGIKWGACRINRKLLSKHLSDFFGDPFLSRVDPAFRKQNISGWVKAFEEKSNTETPLHRHVLLVFFLFRTYAAFREQAEAVLNEMPVPEQNPRTRIAKDATDQANELFKLLETFAVRANSQIKQLWVTHPSSMRRLFRLSPEFFKKLEAKLRAMPRRRKKAMTKKATQLVTTTVDKLWAEALEKTARELYDSNDRPIRITQNRIVESTSFHPKGIRAPNAVDHPLSKRTLEMQAESQWHFYARRITWTLQSLIDVETQDYLIVRTAGLEFHKGHAVLAYFSDCPRGLGTSSTAVAEYLASKDIQLNWKGPAPGRQFDNPGRTYHLRTERQGVIGDLVARPYAKHDHRPHKPPTPPTTFTRR